MSLKIKELSIRGRVAYLIMCFEKYVVTKYPNRDWNPVDDMMWKICDDSDYIDNSAYRYMEIIPEYLYEFDTYKESDFEYLSNNDYEMFKSIIPINDAGLDTIMHSIYDVAMEYAYTAIPDGAPNTVPYIESVLNLLHEENIEPPSISCVEKYTDKEHWWGHAFDGRYLSIIVNDACK